MIDPRARTITLAEVERLQAIERQARRLLEYEYPRPNSHPTEAGRRGWEKLRELLEQRTGRSAAPE